MSATIIASMIVAKSQQLKAISKISMVPAVIKVFLMSMDIRAVLVYLVNMVLCALVMIPALRRYDRKLLAEEQKEQEYKWNKRCFPDRGSVSVFTRRPSRDILPPVGGTEAAGWGRL